MDKYTFNKILLSIVFLITLTGCFRVNHQTKLKSINSSECSLYQQDSTWIHVWEKMKEWNDFIFENSNYLKDSNFVELEIRLKNIDTIINIKLWYISNNLSKEITNGRIYYDPKSYDYNNLYQSISIQDTLINYIFSNPSWNMGTLLVAKSKPDLEIEKADNFVIDIFLDCKIDRKDTIIHLVDTLYKEKKQRFGISVH
jgi:hypothetical protein